MNIGQVLEYLMTNSCCLGSLNINTILKIQYIPMYLIYRVFLASAFENLRITISI